MTSGSLYFKLLKEDFRRRLWAIALVFLAFFFTLPIGLALNMENAANTNYYRYNDYEPFIQDAAMTDLQYKTRLLELKTEVVLNGVEYGNGMIAFLMITAAVVIGVSSFAYLHNKKKVDFYHSIPVRREALFGVQFSGGIFIVGAAYGLNLLLLTGVAMSYGVPAGRILGAMAGGWALNMLYYALMYSTAVAAMMMTGNIVGGQVPVSIQRIHQFLWLEDERTVKTCSGAHLYGTGIFGSYHTGFGAVPQTSVRSSWESYGI